jgi:small conductance mechanosensitive channel
MFIRFPGLRAAAVNVLCFAFVFVAAAAAVASDAKPVTTVDPSIAKEDLALLLVPLSKEDLLVEVAGWQQLVKAKAEEIARAEIAVRRQSVEIAKAEAITEKAMEAEEQLQEVAARIEEARDTGDQEKIAEALDAVREAGESIREVDVSIEETVESAKDAAAFASEEGEDARRSLDETAEAARRAREAIAGIEELIDSTGVEDPEAVEGVAQEAHAQVTSAQTATERVQDNVAQTLADAMEATEKAAALEKAGTAVAETGELQRAEKIALLEQVTLLREQRTLLLDNMREAVDGLERKTDKDDADTLAKIKDYRRYMSTVSGIHVDVTDTTSAWLSLKGWAMSREGGIRVLVNLASFVGILILAWFLSRLSSRAVDKAMSHMAVPALLRDFLVKSARWVVMIIGVIWALAALEVSIGPLLALVGAAGFILAFAMQDSLSNFASGLMILFFRPFDTGDVVEAGGVSGTVRSMNLVSTTIRTFDNSLMVVPNSKIWSDVITNITGVTERRVDLEFGIGYSDDIDKAQQILEEIVAAHPKVLQEPAPVIKLAALADSSVNFICRPWARPKDYWDVFWDITREVKKRFDAAGVGIPFPQRDIHLYIEKGGENRAMAATTGAHGTRAADPAREGTHADGGLDAPESTG